MSSKVNKVSDTKVELQVVGDLATLQEAKKHVLTMLKTEVSAPGFRKGKVPLNIVEKHVDKAHLEREFLDHAMTHLYQDALKEHKLRPITQPRVDVTKFVPFTTLEFKVETEVVPTITLPKYKTMKKKKPVVKIEEKDVDDVIENIRLRMAEKKEVSRVSKEGDEIVIDFVGLDEKGEKIKGGSGNDYPLRLGSNTFIPGFEKNLLGLKKDEDRTFDLNFPDEYGVKALAGRKATFTANVTKVQEVLLPEVDDAFAIKAGPFKTVKELKEDVKKQLLKQREKDEAQKVKNEIVEEVADKSKLELPEALVENQAEAIKRDMIQNLTYRGQTWDEFLAQEGTTEDVYKTKKLLPDAKLRVRIGLVLSEIAEQEKITVTPEEFEVQVQLLKGQHQDEQMQKQLETPEARREIMSQMLSSKTVEFLYESIAN